ncbi:MAG: hypothetical protein DRP66_10785 [Planctomycetota bacterium]|nr:MAG: hypothetical protein DRP66_10785 [Planctomycetota bacterium]
MENGSPVEGDLQDEARGKYVAGYKKAHPIGRAGVADVADVAEHIDHAVKLVGVQIANCGIVEKVPEAAGVCSLIRITFFAFGLTATETRAE